MTTSLSSFNDTKTKSVFTTYSNEDGCMTKESLLRVPMIAELLSIGILEDSEINEFWKSAAKTSDTIDFDSFIQIYKNIDDLFEEGEYDEDEDYEEDDDNEDEDDIEDVITDETDVLFASNLTAVFEKLCNDNDEKTVTKEILTKDWAELANLLNANVVSIEQVKKIWVQTVDENGKMNIDGFLRFNTLLDGLFEFEDDLKEISELFELGKYEDDYYTDKEEEEHV
eukprot:CAMPEP_0194160058 /NCGR_PEP_ID=MMETSP0152-20130528/78179_1 /TAXON_ID=1049557 /ORGANISM="Thalassiothrix antarctica, Strain L6-D1" /LENGTH=225 /DNA_ID=CAMNT_0038869705 /DNA_START=650 /DNA_END=1327 /DNA_ORIENTATION=-